MTEEPGIVFRGEPVPFEPLMTRNPRGWWGLLQTIMSDGLQVPLWHALVVRPDSCIYTCCGIRIGAPTVGVTLETTLINALPDRNQGGYCTDCQEAVAKWLIDRL